MEREDQVIKQILKNFRKSNLHKNEFFESDSEIIQLGDKNYLITVDNYSDEDHFRIGNPYNLGMNLATCTLSDIFACGSKPLFFCNSLSKQNNWNLKYIDLLSKGISHVLNECNTDFVGGDIGISKKWNFTGIAIGESEKIITRKGAKSGDLIFLTGDIGRGNFESASQLSKISIGLKSLFKENPVIFPVRLKESQLISKFANCCIDTSDGLLKSLNIISEINNVGFIVSDIPYYSAGKLLTEKLKLPEEILMFGETGEYELLFTVSPDIENTLLQDADSANVQLRKIGLITENSSKILMKKDSKISLNDFDIWARNFKNHYEYLKSLTDYLSNKIQLKNE